MPIGTSTVGSFITESISSVSGLSISADAAIVGTLFALFLLLAWWLGVGRFTALLLGIYIAVPLYLNFPYVSQFMPESLATSPRGTFYSYAAVFAAFALLSFIILRRYVLTGRGDVMLPGAVEYLALAATATGLTLAVGYRLLPLELLYDFGPGIDRLFATPSYFFWWLLAPLAAVFLATRR